MARLTFLVLLAAAFSSICTATPSIQDVLLQNIVASGIRSGNGMIVRVDLIQGHPSDPVHIETIDISPDPPQPGKDLTVTVTGVATEPIEEGAYADVTVKVGLIQLLKKEFDVCEEARTANASIQCPVEKGTHKVIQTVALPKEIPPAPFAVNIRAFTVDDDDMACLDIKIDFRKTPGRGRLS
ncbi:Phosphatidylglycerol/phosphatidylinositol transfer protein [Grifola frondosa]|uniref:Phosphatidylglycerol/phosphatidylinositol transfer protein n=1 Tax=Grifola frondosa TaxID=5627 RepID=A0A1C7MY13_GRIFR|nr:Phosphatidylglycerol/phosphatidylinositol transfer protein [Grifola frondosa]